MKIEETVAVTSRKEAFRLCHITFVLKMDFVDNRLMSEFIFVNFNSRGECGCGESFMK